MSYLCIYFLQCEKLPFIFLVMLIKEVQFKLSSNIKVGKWFINLNVGSKRVKFIKNTNLQITMCTYYIFFFFNCYSCLLTFFLCMYVCMYVCMYGFVGSSFLCEGSLQLWQAGATLHRGAWASHYLGLSLPSTGSRRAGSVIVAHGPSCSAARGILPDQDSNPRPLHRQADSQPLRHQGSPTYYICNNSYIPALI